MYNTCRTQFVTRRSNFIFLLPTTRFIAKGLRDTRKKKLRFKIFTLYLPQS